MLAISLFSLLASGIVIAWFLFCRQERRRRLSPIVASIARAERHLNFAQKLPAQLILTERMAEWEGASLAGAEATRKAIETEFPVPPSPGPRDGLEEIFARLATTLGDPKLAIAVAGGEQLVQNLFEIVSPEAAGHVADATAIVLKDGLLQCAMGAAQGAIGPALMQYVSAHGILHVLEHHALSMSALTHIPGHALDTLHSASVELAKGFADVASHVHQAASEGATGALGHAHAGHAVSHAASHAGHAAGALGAHVPWVTIVLSGFRETKLLIEEKTTASRALAHVAVDAVATGGGALAGAKGGAFIGAAGGPVGALVGGVFGAILGALGGRYLAEKGKGMKLQLVVKELEERTRQAESALGSSALVFASGVRESCASAAGEYRESLNRAPDFKELLQQNIFQAEASASLIDGVQQEFLATAQDAKAELEAIRIPVPRVWEKLLGLDVGSEARRLLVEAHERCLDWASERRRSLPAKGDNPADIYRSLMVLHCPKSSGSHFLRAAERAAVFPKQFMETLGLWLAEAAVAFQGGALALQSVATREMERHRGEVSRWRKSLEEKEVEVQRECEALGRS